jgi:hypothetical protein
LGVKEDKMKKKNMKISVVIAIAAALNTLFFPAVRAESNTYTIRIACVIPAVPGKNVPIVKEIKPSNTKEQISANLVLQKDTKETRVIDGNKSEVQVQTFYSR